jgi:hypothetical protein
MWSLVLTLLACAHAGGAKERKVQKADPFSPLNLARAVREVVPLVERASGRPFLTPPVVELATTEGMKAMALEEDALISAAVLRDTPEALRQQIAEARAEAAGTAGLLGKYGLFTDKLVLCKDEIAAAAVGSGLPSSAIPDVLLVVLAHELTHALHDQHVDLAEQIRQLPDQDALWAASGTWEGLATWVSERVAAELGLQETWVWMASLQGWSPSGLDIKTAYPVWAMYGRGRDTMARHFELGGLDRVWSVAAQPPQTSAGLFRPDSWPAARTPPAVDYAAVLRTTDQVLTKADWVVGISVLGEFHLRGEAVIGGNEPALDEILAHLRQSWALEATRTDRQGEIRILEFDDATWPARYLDALREQQTADAALLAQAIDREVEVTYTPFTQVPADSATLRTSRVMGAGGVSTERHAAWVVRQSTLVVVTAEGFRPGLRLGWTVDEVFRRLEAARQGAPLPEPLQR